MTEKSNVTLSFGGGATQCPEVSEISNGKHKPYDCASWFGIKAVSPRLNIPTSISENPTPADDRHLPYLREDGVLEIKPASSVYFPN